MKKIIILSFLLFSLIPLYSATITFDSSVPEEYRIIIEKEISSNTEGRIEGLDFSVSDFSIDTDTFPNQFLTSFTITPLLDGNPVKKEVEKKNEELDIDSKDSSLDETSEDVTLIIRALSEKEKKIKNEIKKEIYRAFFYSTLFPSSNLFILNGTYAINALDHKYTKGTIYKATDLNDKTRALFVVNSKVDNIALFSPLYLNNMKPDFQIKKASPIKWNLSGAMDFNLSSYFFSAELSYSTITYPFIPKLGVAYLNDNNSSFYYASLGFESRLPLNLIFSNTTFTLIEDGALGASASLLLGANELGKFDISGTFSVYYEHRIVPAFSWSIGYSLLPSNKDGITLAVGGYF